MADLSIRGMWDEAGRRFQARTERSLDLKPPKSIDDIRDMIERRYDPSSPADSDSDGGHERAKRIGLNILSCIKLLGGVAAQGAELSTHEFHGTIDAVFGIVGPTLSQFKIYERIELFNTIDPELNTAIHKVMISFVDICALAIVLRKGSRWKRFKAATKQALLNDDSGLKDEIEQFEKLVKGQQNVQATLTLEVALSAKADLATILGKACETGKRIDDIAIGILDLKEAETNRSLEKSRQENLTKIRTKLAIEEKSIKASKDVYSGDWLRDMEDYQKWSDKSTNDASPLLVLTGEAHSGKSSAMSTIVHQLKAAHESQGQSTARALVAYYFFPFFAKKADDDKRPGTTAVKHIAYQLAEQDSGTAKSMAAFCDDKHSESYFRDSSCKELWRELKIGTPKPGTMHFIVIDGLDGLFEGHPEAASHFLDIFETIQSQTSTGSDGNRVRLISLQSAPNIEIEKYNGSDITSYIYEELTKTNLLQGEESETTRLRTKVHDRLLEEAKGNFLKVQTALEKIKDLIMSDGSEAEMDTILDESNQDKRTISENVILELQQSLKPQSIEELNELLIWIVYGFVYFDAADLEAARKLEDKLKGMYSKLFFSHYGNVAILPSIEPLITKERDRPRISEDAPKISLNLTISNGDITTVQNFLWSLFQKSMVEKFEFEPYLALRYDAHLAIVKQSLRFLTSPPDERTKLLGTYIVRELHGHLERLNQAVGYDQILASDKKEIGDGLFALFVSGDVIEKHWESFSKIDWVGQSDRIEIFRNWLKDPDAIGHLGRLDKDWLRTVNSSQRPNRELLTPMMKTVAEHWLLDNKWHAGTCFHALRLFLRLVSYISRTIMIAKPSEDESAVPTTQAISEELEAAEKWCEEMLSPKTLGSLWYERLGEAARYYYEPDWAIVKFTKASECDDASISCFKSLAEAYYDNDELLSACSSMEKALDVVNAAETPDKEELKSIYLRLAFWYNHLQQPDRAIVHYEKALEVDPDNQEALSGILTTSIASGAEQTIYDLILNMSKLSSKEPGLDQLASTILDQSLDYSYKAPLRTLVHRCLSQQSCMAALLDATDQAIEAARKKGMEIELLALLLLRGLASLFNDLQDSQSSPQAVAFWIDSYTTMDQLIRKVDNEEDVWRYQTFYRSIVGHLSSYYFEQARKSSDLSEYYLKLEELRRGFRFPGIEGIHAADLFTSAFHTLHGNRAAARETVKQYMRISMDNLSDDTDENDYWAAYIQFKSKALNLEAGPQQWLIDEMTKFVKAKCPLGATQSDRVNAVKTELEARLAATSKEGDEPKQTELCMEIQKALAALESVQSKDIAKTFGYTCDGTCGETPLDFNNGLNVCKYCWNVGFCDECLPQLKANKLKKIVCSPSHEWLAIPKWNPRGNAAARDGVVQVGGELVDGVRVGGETVTVKEWLASLKKEWQL
ncbi:hypothetical protein CI102_6702 [Trichoderma harzianum]|nr:hypothetical protein CI102_6702 [Trichoderma harzianum]